MLEVIVGATAAVVVVEANELVTGVTVFVMDSPTFLVIPPEPNENTPVDLAAKLKPPEDGVLVMEAVDADGSVVGKVVGKPDNVELGDVTPGFPKPN